MSEENVVEGEQKTPEIQLIIKPLGNGKIQVDGPINNYPLCLWLLEEARDVVKAFNHQPPTIQPVKNGIMNFVKGKRF